MVSNKDIRQAAYEIFAEKGFGVTTVQDIASALGIQKQSLYSHYSSKKELITDVVQEQSGLILNEVEGMIKQINEQAYEAVLKSIFEKLVKILSDRTRLLFWKRVFLGVNEPAFADLIRTNELTFQKKLFRTLRQFAAEKNAEFVDEQHFLSFLRTYFLAIQGYHDWTMMDPNAPDMYEAIWDCLWNGIKTCFKAPQ